MIRGEDEDAAPCRVPRPAPAQHRHGGRAMPHLLDPKRIATQATYLAALEELDALMAEDPDSSAGHRIDELFALIEDYEFRHGAARAPAD
jgi:hypothetical protein